MPIVSFINTKGGVGKTTLAVNVAGQLQESGRAVTLLDCDEQASALMWASHGCLPVKVVPGTLRDESPEEIKKWYRGVCDYESEYVLIDSPPKCAALTGAILSLTDLAVVPCRSSSLDIAATTETIELIQEARRIRGNGRPYCLVVPSQLDPRTNISRHIRQVLEMFKEPVGSGIGQRTAFVYSAVHGQWIGSYKSDSPAAMEIQELTAAIRNMVAGGAGEPDAPPKQVKEKRPIRPRKRRRWTQWMTPR